MPERVETGACVADANIVFHDGVLLEITGDRRDDARFLCRVRRAAERPDRAGPRDAHDDARQRIERAAFDIACDAVRARGANRVREPHRQDEMRRKPRPGIVAAAVAAAENRRIHRNRERAGPIRGEPRGELRARIGEIGVMKTIRRPDCLRAYALRRAYRDEAFQRGARAGHDGLRRVVLDRDAHVAHRVRDRARFDQRARRVGVRRNRGHHAVGRRGRLQRRDPVAHDPRALLDRIHAAAHQRRDLAEAVSDQHVGRDAARMQHAEHPDRRAEDAELQQVRRFAQPRIDPRIVAPQRARQRTAEPFARDRVDRVEHLSHAAVFAAQFPQRARIERPLSREQECAPSRRCVDRVRPRVTQPASFHNPNLPRLSASFSRAVRHFDTASTRWRRASASADCAFSRSVNVPTPAL
ncbi:hypothetical protein BME24068_02932 [Burkholderia metallica]|nr:hypothetical protein BME24068_02932 [Burkholderia metallica]